MPQRPRDEDPFGLGQREGRDLIPWLADPVDAFIRAEKRTPALSAASLILAALGSEVLYFGLIGGIFSSYDRKTSLRIATAVLPSVAVNQFIKARFRFPRPPRAAMHPFAFVAPGDFTFPSGHAQNAITLGLLAAFRSEVRWLQYLGVAFGLCVPLSRVYLGVHYPRDVWTGALLASATFAATYSSEKNFVKWWNRSPRGARGVALAISLGIAGTLTGTPLAAFPLGMGGGLALGQDVSGQINQTLDEKVSTRRRVAYGILGTSVFIGTGFAVRPLLKKETSAAAVIAGGTVGLALTLGVPIATNLLKRTTLAFKGIKKRRDAARKRERELELARRRRRRAANK